jgi:hypothetical protein
LGLKAALEASLDIAVEDFDLPARVDCLDTSELIDSARQNRLLFCIGAALRHEEKRL